MCLEIVDEREVRDNFKDSIPEEGLTVYKVARNMPYECGERQYYPLFQHMYIPYKTGLHEANTTEYVQTNYNMNNYQAGFHFWFRKIDAEKYKKYLCDAGDFVIGDLEIIECKIKKEWITATGMNTLGKMDNAKAIVANKAIFPECEGKE